MKCRTVRYVQEPSKEKYINTGPLKMVLGDTMVRYEFGDRDDWRGRRMGTELINDTKKP